MSRIKQLDYCAEPNVRVPTGILLKKLDGCEESRIEYASSARRRFN